MSNFVADAQNVERFIGTTIPISVTMVPEQSTVGWTVRFDLLKKLSSLTAIVSKNCTVGGGTGGAVISCTLTPADTVKLPEETYSYKFVRTDSTSEEVLAYGAFDLVYPTAT